MKEAESMATKPIVFTRPALAVMVEPSTFTPPTTRAETREEWQCQDGADVAGVQGLGGDGNCVSSRVRRDDYGWSRLP
jgi:hypothetical protein